MASRTVTRVPAMIGYSPAMTGTISATSTCIASTSGSRSKLTMSKFTVSATNVVSQRAPTTPSGSAITSASTPNTSTSEKYIRTTCPSRAPNAFIMPIWRLWRARIAVMTLTIRKLLNTSANTLIAASTSVSASMVEAAGCLPGSAM